MEKISKNIQHGKTNTVTDTSSVDRHTLRLQTRRHKTVLKTKQEVKQITPKQCKWTKMTRNWFCCTLYCTIISPHAVHTHAVNFTHTTTWGHAPMSPSWLCHWLRPPGLLQLWVLTSMSLECCKSSQSKLVSGHPMPGQADSIHVVLPIKTQSMGVPDYTDSHTIITTTTTICTAPYSRNFSDI